MGVGEGNLGKKKKYVVLLEFYGPAPSSATLELKNSLTRLLKQYGGMKLEDVSADKRKFDPPEGLAKGFNPPNPEQEVRRAAARRRRRKKPR